MTLTGAQATVVSTPSPNYISAPGRFLRWNEIPLELRPHSIFLDCSSSEVSARGTFSLSSFLPTGVPTIRLSGNRAFSGIASIHYADGEFLADFLFERLSALRFFVAPIEDGVLSAEIARDSYDIDYLPLMGPIHQQSRGSTDGALTLIVEEDEPVHGWIWERAGHRILRGYFARAPSEAVPTLMTSGRYLQLEIGEVNGAERVDVYANTTANELWSPPFLWVGNYETRSTHKIWLPDVCDVVIAKANNQTVCRASRDPGSYFIGICQ